MTFNGMLLETTDRLLTNEGKYCFAFVTINISLPIFIEVCDLQSNETPT